MSVLNSALKPPVASQFAPPLLGRARRDERGFLVGRGQRQGDQGTHGHADDGKDHTKEAAPEGADDLCQLFFSVTLDHAPTGINYRSLSI